MRLIPSAAPRRHPSRARPSFNLASAADGSYGGPVAGKGRTTARTALFAGALCCLLLVLLWPRAAESTIFSFKCQGKEVDARFFTRMDDAKIVGTKKADVILGGGGPNRIDGNGGNDTICGGGGNDRIFGDGGRDDIRGEEGKDVIFGGPADDDIRSGLGDDPLLEGEGGNDAILGGPGEDGIDGGAGPDMFLEGQAGNDTIEGGAGKDELGGGNGSDFLNGRAGNDYMEGNAGSDTCRGGDGFDRCKGGTPSPANSANDPDFCAKDVERKSDCRAVLFPARFTLTTTGEGRYEGVVESWDGTVTLNRSSQSASDASYNFMDSSGAVNWKIAGQDSSGCTYQGEATVSVKAELALQPELGGYAGKLRSDDGSKTITVDCPVGPPRAEEYSPLAFKDISTDYRPFTEGQTVLRGSRTYDGDPFSAPGVLTIKFNWNFTAD